MRFLAGFAILIGVWAATFSDRVWTFAAHLWREYHLWIGCAALAACLAAKLLEVHAARKSDRARYGR